MNPLSREASALDAAVTTWIARFGHEPAPADREALVARLLEEAPEDANVVVDALRSVSFEQFVAAVIARQRGRS
ncbi:MAG: hypothetical protein Q8O67_15165 [Deltaproteobacteria bacterium]|nr:hypothetical protein [Deltaproteobacteria bacterium]